MRKDVDKSGTTVRNRLSRRNFVATAGAGALVAGTGFVPKKVYRPEEGDGEIHPGLAARGRQHLVLRRQAVLDQGRHRRRHREGHRLGRGDPGDRPGQVRVRHPRRAQFDPAGGQGPAAAVARLLQLRHHHGRRGAAGIADQGAGRPQGQEGRLDPDLGRISLPAGLPQECRPHHGRHPVDLARQQGARERADRQAVRRHHLLCRERPAQDHGGRHQSARLPLQQVRPALLRPLAHHDERVLRQGEGVVRGDDRWASPKA